MVQIELSPDINHCIETAARHEYNKLLTVCLLGSRVDNEIKEKLEMLRIFLETMDFRKLRQQCDRYLQNGKPLRFVVSHTKGKISYQIIPD